jgi:hypothetical protein
MASIANRFTLCASKVAKAAKTEGRFPAWFYPSKIRKTRHQLTTGFLIFISYFEQAIHNESYNNQTGLSVS